MTDKKTTGNFGEQAAADYLITKGYRIIKRNFYCRTGEIDIIATDGEYTIFVEVKTRKTALYGRASEFVDWHKQQKIIKTALSYIGASDTPLRFDVIEVYYHESAGKKTIDSVNHIENAFS